MSKKTNIAVILSLTFVFTSCKAEKTTSVQSTESDISTVCSEASNSKTSIAFSETTTVTTADSEENEPEYSKCWLIDLNYDGFNDIAYKLKNDPEGDKIRIDLITDINNSDTLIDNVDSLDFYRKDKKDIPNDSYYVTPVIISDLNFKGYYLFGTDEPKPYFDSSYGYDSEIGKYASGNNYISKEEYDYGIEHMLDGWEYVETKKLDDYSVSVEEFKEYINYVKYPKVTNYWLMDLNYDGVDDLLFKFANDPKGNKIHFYLSDYVHYYVREDNTFNNIFDDWFIDYCDSISFYSKNKGTEDVEYAFPTIKTNEKTGLHFNFLYGTEEYIHCNSGYCYSEKNNKYGIGSYDMKFATKKEYDYELEHMLDGWEYIETKKLDDYSVSAEEGIKYIASHNN